MRKSTALDTIRFWTGRSMGILVVGLVTFLAIKGSLAYCREMAIFDLRRIEVRGNKILDRANIIEAMALPLTGDIFDLDLRKVQSRIELCNYVYGVRVGRVLPQTIFVDVIENLPLAYVSASEYFVLTAEGEALPLPHGRMDLELPTVTGVDSALTALNMGLVKDHRQLERAQADLLFLRNRYPNLYDELSEIVYQDDGQVTLYLAENSTAVRLGDADFTERVVLLDAFLSTVRGKRLIGDYAYIDLRYNRQVIVRERV